MDDMALQDKPGLLTRLGTIFTRPLDDEEDDMRSEPRTGKTLVVKPAHRYMVSVRRQITSFEDAMAAAVGLKRGEQQILNLSSTEPGMRQKIVDFMSGVNFAQEGTWEEVGEHIYLVAPGFAYVEVAPPTPRVTALKN